MLLDDTNSGLRVILCILLIQRYIVLAGSIHLAPGRWQRFDCDLPVNISENHIQTHLFCNRIPEILVDTSSEVLVNITKC